MVHRSFSAELPSADLCRAYMATQPIGCRVLLADYWYVAGNGKGRRDYYRALYRYFAGYSGRVIAYRKPVVSSRSHDPLNTLTTVRHSAGPVVYFTLNYNSYTRFHTCLGSSDGKMGKGGPGLPILRPVFPLCSNDGKGKCIQTELDLIHSTQLTFSDSIRMKTVTKPEKSIVFTLRYIRLLAYVTSAPGTMQEVPPSPLTTVSAIPQPSQPHKAGATNAYSLRTSNSDSKFKIFLCPANRRLKFPPM